MPKKPGPPPSNRPNRPHPAPRRRKKPTTSASEDQYRALVENSPDVIANLDRQGTILFINHTLPQYTVSEVIGTNLARYLSAEDTSRYLQGIKKMFATGKPQSIEVAAAGPTYWLSRIFPMRRNGKVESALMIATDVTERKRTERALRESNELNRQIIETVPGGIVQVDANGAIRLANKEAERFLGLRFDELTHLYITDFDTQTIREDGTPFESRDYPVSRCLAAGKPQPAALIGVRRPDGRIGWGIFSAMPMRDPKSGALSGAVVTFLDISDRKKAEEEVKRSRQQLRDLSARLQKMLEEERMRISREIHDELGQQLTILKMELSWLTKQLSGNPLLHLRTQSMSKLVDGTIQSVRKISTQIRPGVLDDLGITAAMEWQVEEFKARTQMRCHFTVPPEEITLDSGRSTTVFRIFQETLTNIIRHADADEVKISLEKKDDHLIVMVSDNGRGIESDQITHSKSLGLLGMRERALLWGGTVEIEGRRGRGTTVSVRIPLPPAGGEEGGS
ncbi:MAG: PAS domain S-box protein [Nitrospirae bacterium]|nr:PAS domain S-box protein [Candidatus Manganitrophaceae bacterium]